MAEEWLATSSYVQLEKICDNILKSYQLCILLTLVIKYYFFEDSLNITLCTKPALLFAEAYPFKKTETKARFAVLKKACLFHLPYLVNLRKLYR
jgi:hypothetical protein